MSLIRLQRHLNTLSTLKVEVFEMKKGREKIIINGNQQWRCTYRTPKINSSTGDILSVQPDWCELHFPDACPQNSVIIVTSDLRTPIKKIKIKNRKEKLKNFATINRIKIRRRFNALVGVRWRRDSRITSLLAKY